MEYFKTIPKRIWLTILHLMLVPVVVIAVIWLEHPTYITRQRWFPKDIDLDFL